MNPLIKPRKQGKIPQYRKVCPTCNRRHYQFEYATCAVAASRRGKEAGV